MSTRHITPVFLLAAALLAQGASAQTPLRPARFIIPPSGQSEFLSVFALTVLSIWLRQQGSPESKPVGTPHTATGIEG